MAPTDILHLEPHGVDTYVGSGPQYPWGGLYGGQIIAQALRAATLSLGDEGKVPHSLRAYFIRPGDHDDIPVERGSRCFSCRLVWNRGRFSHAPPSAIARPAMSWTVRTERPATNSADGSGDTRSKNHNEYSGHPER